ALQAAPGVEDVAAIAEGPRGVGNEAPRIDDIALRAHRMYLQGSGDPVAPHPLGGAVVIGGHYRIGMRAVEEGARAADREPFLMDRADAADQRENAEQGKGAHRVGSPVTTGFL